jgi:hypothetical protein
VQQLAAAGVAGAEHQHVFLGGHKKEKSKMS